MRALVGTDIGSYSFDASAKTITFIGCGNVKLEDIDCIVDVTLGVEIYNHEEKTGTINNNVLSLTYITNGMQDTDKLRIFINIEDTFSQDMLDMLTLLRRISHQADSLSTVDVANRQRVVVESILGTTLGRALAGTDSGAGVASPNIITPNAPSIGAPNAIYYQPVWVGPVDQRWLIKDQARNTYANSIRSNLV